MKLFSAPMAMNLAERRRAQRTIDNEVDKVILKGLKRRRKAAVMKEVSDCVSDLYTHRRGFLLDSPLQHHEQYAQFTRSIDGLNIV